MADSPDELLQRRGKATRNKIIAAAAERLDEHGYSATSLTDVALLANVEPAMVSFHFPTIEDLVEAVLRAGIDYARSKIDEALDALEPDATGADRLSVAIGVYLEAISRQQHVTRANIRCYRTVPPVLRRGLAVHMREFVETWTELLDAGRQDGSLRPDIDVPTCSRMMIAALNSTVSRQTNDVAAVAEQLRRFLLEGLVNR